MFKARADHRLYNTGEIADAIQGNWATVKEYLDLAIWIQQQEKIVRQQVGRSSIYQLKERKPITNDVE
ncbi:MAG: hypothetical protein JSV20_00560 [Candidatus Bathyarchaeota archaeon]|nr:MAG: hypothetical protein JSV20_00560 [Candidatus Bathyarchaeota archaeon]